MRAAVRTMLTTQDEFLFKQALARVEETRRAILGATPESTTSMYATQMRMVWVDRLTLAMRANSDVPDMSERLMMLHQQNRGSAVILDMLAVHRGMLELHREIMRRDWEEGNCCGGCTIV